MDICPKCGLPTQACVCEELAKQEQKITIELIKRKYGKYITVVGGFGNDVKIKDIAKQLKSELACGGTVKNNTIELQGDHKRAVKSVLINAGFSDDSISE